jgi:hypothetical protein
MLVAMFGNFPAAPQRGKFDTPNNSAYFSLDGRVAMSHRASLILRIIYSICLLGATCTHVAMLWQHGVLWDYGGAPLFTRIYWTSLTFLDPLAALLLFVRPYFGLLLTVAIITSDVLHNTLVGVSPRNPMYLSQVAFFLFVAVTVYVAWRGVASEPHREASLSV